MFLIEVIQICKFIKHLRDTVSSYQIVLNVLSSIKFYARLHHHSIDAFNEIETELAIKSVKLNMPKAVKARQLLEPDTFRQI